MNAYDEEQLDQLLIEAAAGWETDNLRPLPIPPPHPSPHPSH
jgi:hypothetical protein